MSSATTDPVLAIRLRNIKAAIKVLSTKTRDLIPVIKSADRPENHILSSDNEAQTVNIAEPGTRATHIAALKLEHASLEDSGSENEQHDPRYDKYVRLLKFGVSLRHLEPQIRTDGLDPTVLARFE